MNEEELVQTEPVDESTENTDAQAVEDFEEGIELTDTASKEEKKEVKQYTDEEIDKLVNDRVNSILPTKIEREKRKLEKVYNEKLSKYEETESILSAGLGTKDITESNKKMREFYEEQGINIPAYTQKPRYSEDDEKTLGESDARKIISLGFDEMQEEANRLADIGNANMTPRERVMFTTLAAELTRQKQVKELAQIGVNEEMINDAGFKSFASQFDSRTPIKTVYEYYTQIKPKKQVEKMGSMKSGPSGKIKDYYTQDEIAALSDEELDNPQIWEAVRKSMTGQ